MVHKVLQRKRSPSARPDEPWALLGPMIPPATQRQRGRRPREVARRAGRNTLGSRNRRGGPWATLPHAWLPTSPG